MEVRGRTRRHIVSGLWIGALAGAVPGALSGASYAATCDCSNPNYVGGAVVGALMCAVPGGLLGAGIGALVRTETWEKVPADRLQLSVVPTDAGLGIGVAVRF